MFCQHNQIFSTSILIKLTRIVYFSYQKNKYNTFNKYKKSQKLNLINKRKKKEYIHARAEIPKQLAHGNTMGRVFKIHNVFLHGLEKK